MSLLPAAMNLPDDIAPLGRPIRAAASPTPDLPPEVAAFNDGDHQPDGTVMRVNKSQTIDEICADIIAGLRRILASLHEEIPPVMVLPAPPHEERPSGYDLLDLLDDDVITPGAALKIAKGGPVPMVVAELLRVRKIVAQEAVHATAQQSKVTDVTLVASDQLPSIAQISGVCAEVKTVSQVAYEHLGRDAMRQRYLGAYASPSHPWNTHEKATP